MMKAVVYGGGNIGRGFIGQLLYESGYSVCYIDIDKELIDKLNMEKEYPIRFVYNDMSKSSEIWIKNVSGIDGNNTGDVIKAIAKADIMAVSVGVNALNRIAENIALGINKRFADENYDALNIILCENMIKADIYMHDGVYAYIDRKYKELFNQKIGFVQAAVGRTVPVQTDEMKDGNPLRITAEEYKYMPVDKKGFKGDIPAVKNFVPYSPFSYFIERKLLLHNMAHAVYAYLGNICGYEYIWQSVENPYITLIALKSMHRSALALSEIYNISMKDLTTHAESLIFRFANKALGDTVKRVGRDLKRKLSPNDRIIGAYNLCEERGVSTAYMCLLTAAAINFKGDPLSGNSADKILNAAGSYEYVKKDIELIERYDKIIKAGAMPEELNAILVSDEEEKDNVI